MKTKNKFGTIPFIVIGLILALTTSCQKGEETTDKITDKDGNVYTSVTIGTQVWMVENLKTTKYNDGTEIPEVTDGVQWRTLTTGAYCWYVNDASTYKTPYGAYYNWWSVNTGKLCPSGWHVPTDADMNILITYLGGTDNAGNKLKEKGTAHWNTLNTTATNESGFTALPGSTRDGAGGGFSPLGNTAWYWYNNKSVADPAYRFIMVGDNGTVTYSSAYTDDGKRHGCNVRCIKN